MNSDTDYKQLMAKYVDGNADAFEAIYDHYKLPLWRYFRRQVGDNGAADDCYAKHLSGWSTTATTMNPQVRFRHIFSALATGGLWISIGAEIKKNLSLMQ